MIKVINAMTEISQEETALLTQINELSKWASLSIKKKARSI